MSITKASLIDLNGQELILDADADTSITADTDDQIDIKIAGSDDFNITANSFNILSGSNASFADSSNAIFGAGSDLQIFHDGNNSKISNTTGGLYLGSDTLGLQSGNHGTNYLTITSGNIVLNEDSNDFDLRVESDNNANMLVVDASADQVGVGTSPSFPFHASSTDSIVGVVDSDNDSGTFLFIRNSDATTGRTANLGFAPANNIEGARIVAEAIEDFSTSANRTADIAFQVRHNGTMAERWRIHSDGAFVSQAQTPVAIGGTPADANFTELGSGYINLARDDTADADQVLFAKNGAIHTKLKTISGAFVIDSASGNVHLTANSNSLNYNGTTLKPFDSDDNLIDLGTSGARYKDLYLSGSLFIGGTGSANEFDDYEEGTLTVGSLNGHTNISALSQTYAEYTKVGNLIHIQAAFAVTPISTGKTSIHFTVPFAMHSASNVGLIGLVSAYPYATNNQAGYIINYTGANNTQVYVETNMDSATATTFNIQMTYRT